MCITSKYGTLRWAVAGLLVCFVCASMATDSSAQAASNRKLALEVANLDRQRIRKLADAALNVAPISITQFPSPAQRGRPARFLLQRRLLVARPE